MTTRDREHLPEHIGSARVRNVLQKTGLSDTTVDKIDDITCRARDYARDHPAQVLGGLSALVIGAGLLAKRGR